MTERPIAGSDDETSERADPRPGRVRSRTDWWGLHPASWFLLVVLVLAANRFLATAHPPAPWQSLGGLLALVVVGMLLGLQTERVPLVHGLLVTFLAAVLGFLVLELQGFGAQVGGARWLGVFVLVIVFTTLWKGLFLTIAALVTQAIRRRTWLA